nr:tobamovirus multiplication protein 1-like [Tanacetum cinerariifolium]
MKKMMMVDLWASAEDWWEVINESRKWQDGIFFTLCVSYALVSLIALIQLIRIEIRVPEYGWTIQKVFHLMNFIVNGVRAVVFGFHLQVFSLHPKVCVWMLLEAPGLLFFSAYTLLVLFWAEIYHQARSLPTDKLRIVYVSVNAVVYFIQGCLWLDLWLDDNSTVQLLGKIFVAVVSLIAALGFLLYGGRLYLMLRQFPHFNYPRMLIRIVPVNALFGRKLITDMYVGSVTGICFICFLVRCFVDVLSAFDSQASLDVLDHPVLNLIFYMLVEILPSALVLYILRKLPPKRVSKYNPIH